VTKRTDSTAATSSRGMYFLGLGAVVLAIATHAYLTNHHLELKYGLSEGESMCNLSGTFNCSAASASKFSEFLGVPMALWGAVTNAVLLVLALMFPFADESNRARARANILAVAGFIALTSIVMGVISITQLDQYCPFCILTYVLSFIAFFGFWKGTSAPSGRAAWYTQVGLKGLIGSAVAIFLLGFVINNGVRKSFVGDNNGFQDMVNSTIHEWQSTSPQTITPVAPMSKGAAEADAKLTIVEFADFRCSHCKHAAPMLDAFVKSHKDVRVIFQTYPLDGECNSAIPTANGASCLLARAAVCAEKQNAGWKAHDYFFAHQDQDNVGTVEGIRKMLEQMAKDVGINGEQLKTCADSDDARKSVEAMARLGTQLNVRGTPTLFVNGRMLNNGQILPVLQAAYESTAK
jgi:protein-disulfide isomerase/uncharacterized membrane protein